MDTAFKWLTGVIVAAVLAILGSVVWLAWTDSQRPTVGLKRDDWECTRSESRTHLQPMLVGKVQMLMPMTSSVCVEYRRKAG